MTFFTQKIIFSYLLLAGLFVLEHLSQDSSQVYLLTIPRWTGLHPTITATPMSTSNAYVSVM